MIHVNLTDLILTSAISDELDDVKDDDDDSEKELFTSNIWLANFKICGWSTNQLHNFSGLEIILSKATSLSSSLSSLPSLSLLLSSPSLSLCFSLPSASSPLSPLSCSLSLVAKPATPLPPLSCSLFLVAKPAIFY